MGLTTGGPSWENFITNGGEGLKVAGREDLEPEDPGISDLISSELARGRHLANFSFTTLSSGLRSGRIPEERTTNAKLGIPYNL